MQIFGSTDPAGTPWSHDYAPPLEPVVTPVGVPPVVFSDHSGITKYIATCTCGVRYEMDAMHTQGILTNPDYYDELKAKLAEANAHEVDATSAEYGGPHPPPMHPHHAMRYWVSLPVQRPVAPEPLPVEPTADRFLPPPGDPPPDTTPSDASGGGPWTQPENQSA